jgi:hypothetical protein
MAVETPLEKSERAAILAFLDQLTHHFPDETEAETQEYEQAGQAFLPLLLRKTAKPAAILTTPTTSTTPTIVT